jgi:hypothetical protein
MLITTLKNKNIDVLDGIYKDRRIFSTSTQDFLLRGEFQNVEIIHYAPIILCKGTSIKNVSFRLIKNDLYSEAISSVQKGVSFDFNRHILSYLCKQLGEYETNGLFKEYANLFQNGYTWNAILGQANIGDTERREHTKRLLKYLVAKGYEDVHVDEYFKQLGD